MLDFFRLLYFFITLFYIFFACSTILNIGFKRDKIIWIYIGLCLGSSGYSFFNFISTFQSTIFTNHIDSWMCFGTTSANLAWLFYLKILQDYLLNDSKIMRLFQVTTIICAGTFFGSLISGLFFDNSLMTDPSSNLPASASVYFDTINIQFKPSVFGMIAHAAQTLNVYIGSIYCFYVLFKYGKGEFWLKLGLLMTLLLNTNDLIIVPGIFYYIIPLAMFGYSIEVIRFYYLFHNRIFSKLDFLENELIKSSKLVEIGLATSSINHDIRNSLAVIKSGAEGLSNINHKDKNAKILSNIIVKQTDKILGVIKTYSEFINHDNEVKEVNLQLAINEAINICSKKFSDTDTRIDVNIPKDFNIKFNKANLELVFMNLISNSIDAISDLKEKWIRIDLLENDNFVKILFLDSGQGIDPKTSSKIFDRQFTTKSGKGGTGLGLFLVKSILTNSKGSIEFSKDYPNTAFILTVKS